MGLIFGGKSDSADKPDDDGNKGNEGEQSATDAIKAAATGPTTADIEESTGANSSAATESRLNEAALDRPTYQGFSSDPSAKDLGVDQPGDKPEHEQVLAEISAANQGIGEDAETIYSSHPIQNLRVGPFVFEGTVLRLKGKALAAFESLLKELPLSERNNISTINTSRVDDIVKERAAAATRQFDSSVGRSSMEALRGQFPVVGDKVVGAGESTEDLQVAHANVAQRDGNELVLTPQPDPDSQDGGNTSE